jgi:hypothetical protein
LHVLTVFIIDCLADSFFSYFFFFFFLWKTDFRPISCRKRQGKQTNRHFFFVSVAKESCTFKGLSRGGRRTNLYSTCIVEFPFFFFASKHSQWFTRAIQVVSILRLCIGIQLCGYTFYLYMCMLVFFPCLFKNNISFRLLRGPKGFPSESPTQDYKGL